MQSIINSLVKNREIGNGDRYTSEEWGRICAFEYRDWQDITWDLTRLGFVEQTHGQTHRALFRRFHSAIRGEEILVHRELMNDPEENVEYCWSVYVFKACIETRKGLNEVMCLPGLSWWALVLKQAFKALRG